MEGGYGYKVNLGLGVVEGGIKGFFGFVWLIENLASTGRTYVVGASWSCCVCLVGWLQGIRVLLLLGGCDGLGLGGFVVILIKFVVFAVGVR